MKKKSYAEPDLPKRLKKILLIMRLTFFLCLLGILHVSATGYAQEYRMDLKMENATVTQVFNKITEITNLDFFYNNAQIDVNRRVTVDLSDATVEEILKEIFKAENVRFDIKEDFIVIHRIPAVQENVRTKQLRGTVKDNNGMPLPGVTVIIKGTATGVSTNSQGEFTISLPEGKEQMLQFTFIGLKQKEVKWNGEATLEVIMEEDDTEIDEVVVLGVANVNRKNMVGSYTQLAMDDVMVNAYSSVDQMLEGQVPGMSVTMSSVRAGSSPSIRIRGTSTLLGSSEPLWVVDGIVQKEIKDVNGVSKMWSTSSQDDSDLSQYVGSQISWLNPNDIETITVLKDASATALYGSRASNGVIVITTKRPTADKVNANFSANWTLKLRPRYQDYKLMNSQERIKFSQEAFNSGVTYLTTPKADMYTYEGLYRLFAESKITEKQFTDQYTFLEGVNTDWLDLLTRNSVNQSYNFSITGAGQKSNYSFSISYNHNKGIEDGNDSRRMTARLALGMNLSEKARLNVTMNGGLTKTTGFATGVSPLNYAVSTSRAIPAYNQDGSRAFYKLNQSYEYNPETEVTGLDYNIMHEMDNTGSSFRAPELSASLNFSWKFMPVFTYELTAGVTLKTRKSEVWADAPSYYITKNYRGYSVGSISPGDPEYYAALLPFGGELQTEDTYNQIYEIRNTLRFEKNFRDLHNLSGQLSWQIESDYVNSKVNTVWGFERDRGERITPPASLSTFKPMGGAAAPTNLGIFQELYSGRWRSTNTRENLASLFFIGTYSYDGKYIFNFNMRNDWSNRFGQNINNRFDPTYSFGLKWRVENEAFMANTWEWLDQLAVRVTYGIQGNVVNSASPELILNKGNASTIYNDYTSMISKLGNPDLDWERTHQWDFGLDLGLFRNRLTLVMDGYIKKSKVLSSMTLNPEHGNYSAPVTGTELRNSGLELSLNVEALKKKDWRITTRINVSKNWDKILKMNFFDTSERTASDYINGQQKTKLLEKGYSYGAFWAYSYAGVNEFGYPVFNNMDMETGTPYTDFLVHMGSRIPLVNGGFNVMVSYKQLSLYAKFSAKLGGKDFLPNPYSSFASGKMPSPVSNLSRDLTQRWKQAGDSDDIPGLYLGGESVIITDPSTSNQNTKDRYLMWAQSDRRVASTSQLKCGSIQLNWNVNKGRLIELTGIRNLSLNASVENVFMIIDKKWDGKDPDLGGMYRQPRSFTVGFNFGF